MIIKLGQFVFMDILRKKKMFREFYIDVLSTVNDVILVLLILFM